ncbi:MAG: hypothetical protein KAS94_02575, partial [Desulfobulbaceae bacterium]|nr:hypothetical protein [Desulfobulbaceae bacterium]
GSGSSGGFLVGVQVSPSAPSFLSQEVLLYFPKISLQLRDFMIIQLLMPNCIVYFCPIRYRHRQADSLTGFNTYVKTAIGDCCPDSAVIPRVIVIST